MLANFFLLVLCAVILSTAAWLTYREDPHHEFILELLHRLVRGTPAIVDGDSHPLTETHEHWDSVTDRHHSRRTHL